MIIPCGYCNNGLDIRLPSDKHMIAWECPVCGAFMILSKRVSKDIRNKENALLLFSLDFLQLIPSLQKAILTHLFREDTGMEEKRNDIDFSILSYGVFFITTAWKKSELLRTSTLARILDVTVDRAGKILKGRFAASAIAKRGVPSRKSCSRGAWRISRDNARKFMLRPATYPSPDKFEEIRIHPK